MKILFLGDVVGAPGRKILSQALPRLIPSWGIDLVVCNAENAAGGSGLTVATFEEIAEAGVDVVTLGDHAYRKDEVHELFDRGERICRPANYPPEAPGPESILAEARDGTVVGVFALLGRTYLKPVDCPFRAADRVLETLRGRAAVILVDIHAEATSDKQTLGRYLDGKVAAVLGTHTHVPTADDQLLPGGTAYQTDVGMTGPYDSIIGRRYDHALAAMTSPVPLRLDVATGDPRLCGALVEADPTTGLATAIRRVAITQDEARQLLTDPNALD